MSTTLHGILLVAPIWLIALWRLPDAWRASGSRRRMWATFTMLATALTAGLPPISHALARVTGRPDSSVLLMHLCGTGASYLLMGWIHATGALHAGSTTGPTTRLTGKAATRPHRWHALVRTRTRRLLLTACLLLQVLSFTFSVQVADAQHYNMGQAGDLAGTVHVILYEGYIALAVGLAALMCAEIHRRDRRGLLGVCMGIMCVGCWLGVGYALQQVTFDLLPLHPALAIRQPALYTLATRLLSDGAILLIILGTSVRAFEALRQTVVRHWLLVRLRPLWSELGAALDPRTVDSVPGAWRERLSLRRTRTGLTERWLQIHDAAVVLAGWVPPGLRERARTAVAELDPPVPAAEREALVAAYCLRRALARLASGDAAPSSSPDALLPAAGDHVQDARWLLSVAAAWHGPLLPRLDAALSAADTATESV